MMKWDLHGTNVRTSTALHEYVEGRIIDRLARFAGGIRNMVLRVRDVDLGNLRSPREITATLTLVGGQTVRLKQEGACFYSAVDAIGDRLRRTVRKRLDQRLFGSRRRQRRRMRRLE